MYDALGYLFDAALGAFLFGCCVYLLVNLFSIDKPR